MSLAIAGHLETTLSQCSSGFLKVFAGLAGTHRKTTVFISRRMVVSIVFIIATTALGEIGIAYVHLPELGGRREPRADSPHRALRVAAFRGYADHMSSAEFARGYERLTGLARESRTAFMCAETLWWRCHRRLIADRLTVDGWTVTHLFAPGKSEPHVLWDAARKAEGHLVYDAGTLPLPT